MCLVGQYAEILKLSEAMLAHAKQHDWPQVIAIRTQRDSLFGAYFSAMKENINQQNQAEISRKISQIINIDKEVMALSINAKNRMAEEITGMQKNKKLIRAYSQG